VTRLDNSALVAPFCPAVDDGDTFIYTEMLDRAKRKGNNGQRLLKTFYHRSVAEFWEQWPTIVRLCDLAKVRACTRIAPRSYKSVGRYFTRLVVDTAMSENWAGMKTLYNRACGCTAPITKLWLYDIDALTEEAERLRGALSDAGLLVAVIPSKKGQHLITWPHQVEKFAADLAVDVHKDNPTNLYIPEGAA
jgi:hypothetical protein